MTLLRLPESVAATTVTKWAPEPLIAAPRPYGVFSQDGRYRYFLAWPTGVQNDRIALGIFANPSTATPDKLDPTLTRWRNYCRAWDYGWSWTCNVRAWRETNPKKVPADPLAIGPDNDLVLAAAATQAALIVCGWGKLGTTEGVRVATMLRAAAIPLHALHVNQDGSPQHPLMLASRLKPIPY